MADKEKSKSQLTTATLPRALANASDPNATSGNVADVLNNMVQAILTYDYRDDYKAVADAINKKVISVNTFIIFDKKVQLAGEVAKLNNK